MTELKMSPCRQEDPGGRKGSFRTWIGAALLVVLGGLIWPTAVQAAGTIVNIADPTNGTKARVQSGRLQVAIPKGTYTVKGAVSAVPVAPAKPLWGLVHLSPTNVDDSFAGPFAISHVFHVTSFTFSSDGTQPFEVRIRTENPGVGATCTTGTRTVVGTWFRAFVPAAQTVSIPFPTPLVANGACLTALVSPAPPSGADMYVTAVGF